MKLKKISVDSSSHLEALFAAFGGKGLFSVAGRARVTARQKNPPRSRRLVCSS